MGNRKITVRLMTSLIALGLPLILVAPAFAASADVGQINSFIKSVIQALAGIASLVATGFFVAGGFKYITSSGNPEHLSSANRTLVYSATGLAIIIAAFVISNIVTVLATNAFGS
jgi:Type IV secretion system pilin